MKYPLVTWSERPQLLPTQDTLPTSPSIVQEQRQGRAFSTILHTCCLRLSEKEPSGAEKTPDPVAMTRIKSKGSHPQCCQLPTVCGSLSHKPGIPKAPTSVPCPVSCCHYSASLSQNKNPTVPRACAHEDSDMSHTAAWLSSPLS
jgi:hypothetical protein